MWSSDRAEPPRGAFRTLRTVALAAVAALALSGCSGFAPVYDDRGIVANARLDFSYAKPGNRLAQVVIKELELKLGKSARTDAPEITISASAGRRQLNQSRVAGGKPTSEFMSTVIVTYSVARDGKVLAEGTRRATAQYVTVGQVLADVSAAEDADLRAAREAAETVRLSILSQLGSPARLR